MQVNKQRLYQDVSFLTSIFPPRNYKNLDSLEKAAKHIKKELSKTGLPIFIQKWEARGNTYKNVIASLNPNKTDRFIIGAHYDVYKSQPGADDNASGVAGLLELARLLADNKSLVDYGIDFVSYCLEEPPFFKKKEMGSYIHAKSVNDGDTNVIGMISLEMIGYYGKKADADEAGSGNNRLIVSGIRKYDGFNKKISQLLRKNSALSSSRLSYANDYRNNGPSDHRNYWKYGYPAVMVIGSSGEGNPNYHKKSDKIETLDFNTFAKAVDAITETLSNFRD